MRSKIIFSSVIVLLLIWILLLFRANLNLKTGIEEAKGRIAADSLTLNLIPGLENRLSLAQDRIEADRLLFEGNREAAFALYRKLDSLTGSNMAETRLKFEAKQEAIVEQKKRLIRLKEKIIEALKEESELAMEMSEAEKQQLTDSLVVMMDELLVLQNMLETEMAMRDEERRLHGYLSFKSTKGKTVKYVGKVVNQKAEGFGIGMWETGSVYEGYWKENQRHGTGTFKWADGEKYVGDFENDKRHGKGVYYWKDGERYEGYWADDKRNGSGTVFKPDGTERAVGFWVNDELKVNELKEIPKGH